MNPAMHGRRLAFRPPALANGNSRPQHKKSKQNDEVSLSVKLFRQIHPDFSHGCQRLVTGFALSSLLLGRKLWLSTPPEWPALGGAAPCAVNDFDFDGAPRPGLARDVRLRGQSGCRRVLRRASANDLKRTLPKSLRLGIDFAVNVISDLGRRRACQSLTASLVH